MLNSFSNFIFIFHFAAHIFIFNVSRNQAKFLTRAGSVIEFADPKLDGEYSVEAFDLTFQLALSCTAIKQQRPSMEQVIVTLQKALDISTSKVSTPETSPNRPSTL